MNQELQTPPSIQEQTTPDEQPAPLEPFTKDGRKTIEELYEVFDQLEADGWNKELIYTQTIQHLGRELSYPVYAYISPTRSQDNLWILGGVHGEEPAGPNAFADSIDVIQSLRTEGFGTVFIPLLNPTGYFRDWRYFNEPRDRDLGSSVTDPDHVLLDSSGTAPRLAAPANPFAEQIIDWVKENILKYPPLVAVDHHEDLLELGSQQIDANNSYGYANGDPALLESLCQNISEALIESGSPIQLSGMTSFGEQIENGFVLNTQDGSIDEFISATEYFDKGEIKTKPAATAVFVIETTRASEDDAQLEKRKSGHAYVMKQYVHLMQKTKEFVERNTEATIQ